MVVGMDFSQIVPSLDMGMRHVDLNDHDDEDDDDDDGVENDNNGRQ